jgi:hypothetical protein
LGGPVFTFAAVEGSGRASPRGAGQQHSVAWVLVVPALFQAGPGATFSRLCPFRGLILSRARGSHRSRVLRGMGARDSCFVSSGPRGDLLTPVPLRGLILSRARGSHRSRVLRGMGARDSCFVSSGPRGDLLTPVPLRGLILSRARSPCRSRVLLALQGTGPLNAPQ